MLSSRRKRKNVWTYFYVYTLLEESEMSSLKKGVLNISQNSEENI